MKQLDDLSAVMKLFLALFALLGCTPHARKMGQDRLGSVEPDSPGKAFDQMIEMRAYIEKKEHAEMDQIKTMLGRLASQDSQQAPVVVMTGEEPEVQNTTVGSKTMFELCKANKGTPPVHSLLADVAKDSLESDDQGDADANASTELANRCQLYESLTTWVRWNNKPGIYCCDTRNEDCNGCARMHRGQCNLREAGFNKLPQEVMHSPCMDMAGWMNRDGKTCAQMSVEDCSARRNQGTSSHEACCKCGGGIRSPAPFSYPDHTFLLGEDVKLWPQPRTSTRFGLNDGCEFALYNLTLDGATGVVAFVNGKDRPKEAFKVSCKVTAFQLHHQLYTADVTVSVAELSYGSSMVTFTPERKSYTLKAKGEWKDFFITCAPEAPWLAMDPSGTLQAVLSEKAGGAIDNIKDVYAGQPGTICQIWANTRASASAEWKKQSMSVVVVKPTAPALLAYPTKVLVSSIGQVIPPVEPVAFGEGEMAPSRYAMQCNKGFTFDSIHGLGFYQGHPVLELTPSTGQLNLKIGPSFARVFDDMGSSPTIDGVLKLHLKCKIVGMFPDPDFAPIFTDMDIVITDSTCWVKEKIPCKSKTRMPGFTRAKCQHTCRNTADCAHYGWHASRRRKEKPGVCYDNKLNSAGHLCDGWTKVTECSSMTTCVNVDATTWLERGTYCPVGYDVDRGSMTYLKEGSTAREMIYLRKFKDGLDDPLEGCEDSKWLLQEKHPKDFQSPSKGVFQFAGPMVGCKVTSVSFASMPCAQPANITEADVDVQPMILDNPDTREPEDYWLHPCDCGNKDWGEAPPMDPTVFSLLPPESHDAFIPSPVLIVEGQFVCPPGAMLGDGPIFESQGAAMEVGDCEIRCKNVENCHFFWHGVQHEANTCRLYRSCEHIVREPGTEGVLKAVPKAPACLVANPEACWRTTLRKQALTSASAPSILHWKLHAECDYMLLLGGWGVSHCAWPTIRELNSHQWQHKRQLPMEFKHGQTLEASCWSERYEAMRLGRKGTEVSTCVNGQWISSSGLSGGFVGFQCLPCVQVGTKGFGDVEDKRQQELYYFNKLSLQLHSEVNPIADAAVNCLEPVRPAPIVESELPKELTESKTFDLLGHDFPLKPDVMGAEALWHKAEQFWFNLFHTPSTNVGTRAQRKKPLTDAPVTSGKGHTCVQNEPCTGPTCNRKRNRWWSVMLKRTVYVMSLEITVGTVEMKDVAIKVGWHTCAKHVTIGQGETRRVRCYARGNRVRLSTGSLNAEAEVAFCGLKVFGQINKPKQAKKKKYFFQSLPEAQAECAKNTNCWMVSRTDGIWVDGNLWRYELRKGNPIPWVGAMTWWKELVVPCAGNCAALRPVTCSRDVSKCSKMAVDGRRETWLQWESPHVWNANKNPKCSDRNSWVKVDLGTVMQFDEVTVWGFSDSRRRRRKRRKYCGHQVAISKDDREWIIPYSSDSYLEQSGAGATTLPVGLQFARYVSVHRARSDFDVHAHFIEIEVRRKSLPQPPELSSRFITESGHAALGGRAICHASLLEMNASMEEAGKRGVSMEGDLDEADEEGQEESEEEEEEEDRGEDQEDEDEEDEEDEDEQDEEDEEDEEESEAPQNNRTGRSLLSKRPRELDEDAEDTAALSEAGAGEVDGSERRRKWWKRHMKKLKKKVRKQVKRAVRRVTTRRRRSRRRRTTTTSTSTTTTTSTSTSTTTTTTTCHYGVGGTGFFVDFSHQGTLKGGSVWFSKGAQKIRCTLYCDHVLTMDVSYDTTRRRKGRTVSIPEVCRGARSVYLWGSGAQGYCAFSHKRLDVYNLAESVTLTGGQVPGVGIAAYGCEAGYRPMGWVTMKVDEFGTVAPGNKVSYMPANFKRATCKVYCDGVLAKKHSFYGRRRRAGTGDFDLPNSCIGASTVALHGGGKCAGCHFKDYKLTVNKHPTNPPKTTVPAKKIVSWFKSEDAGASWRSSVGGFSATTGSRRHGVRVYTARGYGAKAPVKYIQGSTTDTFKFPGVLKDHYTVCAVTRYTSVWAAKRILQGSKTNIIFGHHGTGVGIVYFGGFQTGTGKRQKSTKWTTVCASPGADYVFVDGQNIGTGKSDRFVDQDLVINQGNIPDEKSNWAVMEVITWNYILSKREMEDASTYLMKKLMIGGEEETCKIVLKNPKWHEGRSFSSHKSLAKHSMTMEGWYDSQLDSNSGWCAGQQKRDEWLEIDLQEKQNVMGVVIQGLKGEDKYVYSFEVQYKATAKGSWTNIRNLFTGLNGNPDEHVKAFFSEPVEARYIRLTNFDWHHELCLRAAVMVCQGKLENAVTLLQAKTCPTTYNSESWSESDYASRHLRIGGTKECIAVQPMEKRRLALVYKPCVPDDVHQLIPAADIGYLFTMLHRNAWLMDNVLQPGIKAEFFYSLDQGWGCSFPNIMFRMPDKLEAVPQINFPDSDTWDGLKQNDKFAARFTGVVMVNEPGTYEFFLTANDVARVFLEHKQLLKVTRCRTTASTVSVKKDLTMGSWPLEVHFYENTGNAALKLEWKGPDSGNKRVVVPASAFAHMADRSQWMPTSAVAKGCIGNTALGGLNPGMFNMPELSKGIKMECRFVPLLSKELPVEIITNRTFKGAIGEDGKAASRNAWPNWWEDVETWEMGCPPGKVIQTVDLLNVNDRLHVKYTCATSSGLGACYPSWTNQIDAHEFKDTAKSKAVLSRLGIQCPGYDLLNSLHFEYSVGGLWARFKYMCCKEGGAPVVTMSYGPDKAKVNSLEGTYCPQQVGSSGRMDYLQKAWGRWQTKSPATLSFSEQTGKWCIGGDCSDEGDDVVPAGVSLGGFDITAVSDFDGKFEAKGVGSPGSIFAPGPVPEVKPPPPPKRPPAPKKPELAKFEPQMPKYSDVCTDYGDLWKKVQETTVNEAGEVEANANELETEDEAASGYQDMHPCKLAHTFSGIKNDGSQEEVGPGLSYEDLSGCVARSGAASKRLAKANAWMNAFVKGNGLPAAIGNLMCTMAPNIVLAGGGVGPSDPLQAKCKAKVALANTVLMSLKETMMLNLAEKTRKMDGADCPAETSNFARMFCDIHCIRDAVIRGDRAILRNLKKATDITNGNTAKLSEWIVKTAQLDAGWLGEKIDHQSLVQSIESAKELTTIKEEFAGVQELFQGDKKGLLLAIKQQTSQIQSELKGYVDGASFSHASSLVANDALQKFAADSKSIVKDGNDTQHVFGAFENLLSLQAKLRTSAVQNDKAKHVAQSVVVGARKMQESLKLQRETLGIYRQTSNETKQTVRQRSSIQTSERHTMLLDLDRIWWKLRGAFDDYMEQADEEIRGYEAGSHALLQYEQCASDLKSLLDVYRHTMATADRSHRALKTVWRHASNLVGELASHIADGEAFSTFLQQEGCESTLVQQTLEQMRDAVVGMRMLYDRFEVSKLPKPDIKVVEDAVDRVKSSFAAAAAASCKAAGELSPIYLPYLDMERNVKALEAELADASF